VPGVKLSDRFLADDLLGVRFAVNVFVGTTLVWLGLKLVSDTSPIWAIASMIAATDPVVQQAERVFFGRIVNAMVGCAVGLFVLVVGHSSDWELPFALATTVLISVYVVRVPVMWRQAPITAAIVIASELTYHSKLTGLEHGLRKVAQVIFGCLVGLLVTLAMSRIWPVKGRPSDQSARAAQDSPSR
jgi:Fusaric acid resistance protein-like